LAERFHLFLLSFIVLFIFPGFISRKKVTHSNTITPSLKKSKSFERFFTEFFNIYKKKRSRT
ncbi:MAG: hypothetical protein IKA65_06850, partial [Lentisphaeria bacterium]|nr:hypothetical protein [Lentisphaeria bacterium]